MEGVAEITGVLSFLHHVDKDVTLAINSLSTPLTDTVWQFFSAKTIWSVMYLTVLVFMFIRLGWKKALALIFSCALCILLCDQCSNLVKEAVQRLRPAHDADMLSRGLHLLEDAGGLYGFFSGHAANATGGFVCTYIGFREDKTHSYRTYGICMGIWAFLVGISRVFVGKHYLGDVLVGFAVGIFFGWLCGRLARFVCSKF